MGRQLAAVVDGLLEPLVEDRLTAADALDILSEESQPQSSGAAAERNRYAGTPHSCRHTSLHTSYQGCFISCAGTGQVWA